MRTLRPFARLFYDGIYRTHYFVVCSDISLFQPTLRKLIKLTDLADPQELIDKVSSHALAGCDGRIFRFSMLHKTKPVAVVVIWLRCGADVTTLRRRRDDACARSMARRTLGARSARTRLDARSRRRSDRVLLAVDHAFCTWYSAMTHQEMLNALHKDLDRLRIATANMDRDFMITQERLTIIRKAAAAAGFSDRQSQEYPEDVIRALRQAVDESWSNLDVFRRAIDKACALDWKVRAVSTQAEKDSERIERLSQIKL